MDRFAEAIYAVLPESGGLTNAEIAAAAGVQQRTVDTSLPQLMRQGLVRVDRSSGPPFRWSRSETAE